MIDASADDDDDMLLNVLTYETEGGAPELFASYSDLMSWTQQFLRPLFTTKYTLHTDNIHDGTPEAFTGLVNNF